MYVFTRRVIVNPAHARAGMAHATEMTQYVNQKTGLEVSLYQVLQGAPMGTLAFAYRTDSFAASLDAVDPLLRSDEYLKKVEKGAAYFIGNPEDQLGEIIHVAGEVSGAPAVAGVVSATMEIPRAQAAAAWSVGIADYTANASGLPTAVVTSNYGPYGRVSWISYAESVAQVEEADKKVNSDPGFLQRLGESQDLFVPGSGVGMLSRKIA
jgi:hypothetical protein